MTLSVYIDLESHIIAVSRQVWSADAGVAHSPPSDLLWKSQATWGTGDQIVTVLLNADGEVSPRSTITPQ